MAPNAGLEARETNAGWLAAAVNAWASLANADIAAGLLASETKACGALAIIANACGLEEKACIACELMLLAARLAIAACDWNS